VSSREYDNGTPQPARSSGTYYYQDRSKIEREDVFQEDEVKYWKGGDDLGYQVTEYYDEYGPVHKHEDYASPEHEYEHSYEHWMRSKYSGGASVPVEWSGRGERKRDFRDRYDSQGRIVDGDRYVSKSTSALPTSGRDEQRTYTQARSSSRSRPLPPPPTDDDWGYETEDEPYFADEYAYAPEYYKERYMPEEDYLKKMYMVMFRNIEYDIKIPIMQIIATCALIFIFYLTYEFIITKMVVDGTLTEVTAFDVFVHSLGDNYNILIRHQPPGLAVILASIFGIFLYLFPNMDRDLKRVIIAATILLLIFFFAGPAILAAMIKFDAEYVGQAFAETLANFVIVVAVLVYWAPIYLGIYGIWSRNSFYIGVSAMSLFLVIIILDIYLLASNLPIEKFQNSWLSYVVFSIILFCYIEMSESAVNFAKLTSTENQKEIDPSYYEHLGRILKKYFMYFIIMTVGLIILTWFTLNFSSFLSNIGSIQLAESLELSSIYGIIISLVVISIAILIFGLFLRYERLFRNALGRLGRFILPPQEAQYYPSPSSGPRSGARVGSGSRPRSFYSSGRERVF
jgi:hypothetical protein